MAIQFDVTFVFWLDIQSFSDRQSRVLEILLDVQTHRHVVVSLIVVFVRFYRFLVVVYRLLENADGKVCVCEVLEESVLLLVLQAALENDDGFGITAQNVESRTFVVDCDEGDVVGFMTFFDLLQHTVAEIQAVLRSIQFEV